MYSIPMALVDFIPVFLFGAGAWILQRDLYNKMSKGAYSLLCAGTIDIFMAGSLKALYKLLYAANVCNFEPLSKMFFPVQAIGFTLAGIALVCLVTRKQGKGRIYSVAPVVPAVFSGTMIFVVMMVLGLFGLNFGLSVYAKKMKKSKVIVLFIVAFIFSLMMGYLSSKDFDKSYFNWIAEGVNTIGQGAFFAGVLLLDKAGLASYQTEEE